MREEGNRKNAALIDTKGIFHLNLLAVSTFVYVGYEIFNGQHIKL